MFLISAAVSRLHTLTLCAGVWFSASPLLAQDDGGFEKNYGISYMLVMLCVVLGMLVVCRPFRSRAEKIERPKEDD